jgi:AcrR family transcriptional regulator
VQDVADEAGQSLRTLYQYFESKDDLLLAVFEEVMRTYARMIHDAIAGLDDPLERLAGAIIAAARLREYSGTGVDKGLARLRLKLSEVDPQLVARAQEPVTTVLRDLARAAAGAGQIGRAEPDEIAYLLATLNSGFVISHTLGNDYALPLPEVSSLASFCLAGMGASLADGWYERLNAALRFPRHQIRVDAKSTKRQRTRK